jgi:hypothetical protein
MYQRPETQMESPNLAEVLEVIHSFKNNKAPGIDMMPIELIKIGGNELHNRILRSGKKKKCLKSGTWLFPVLYTKKETNSVVITGL